MSRLLDIELGRWEEQFYNLLREVVSEGGMVEANTPKACREINNYQFTLNNPLDRIIVNPVRSFKMSSAIARFIFMMSGSDRLEEIAFWEEKVRAFSDDSLSIPGSNYGTRLLQMPAGNNQILGAIERINNLPETKRAAAVVWRPEDAVRESKDIPCTFGIQFYVRGGRLNATTLMRSNAAYRLVPFNVFEFTLLTEFVANMTGHQLGKYTHFAVSMHVYDSEMPFVQKMLDGGVDEPCLQMPPMPNTSWDDMTRLIHLFDTLRQETAALTNANYQVQLDACETLNSYWGDFGRVLLACCLVKQNLPLAWHHVVGELSEPFRSLLRRNPPNEQGTRRWEEDPDVLRSRAAFLQLAERNPSFTLQEREICWKKKLGEYQQEVVGKLRDARKMPGTEEEWEDEIVGLRNKATTLFPDL